MVTKAQKKATNKYHKEKMTAVTFRLHNINDAEYIEKYKAIENKAEWFRKALDQVKP